MSNSQADRLAEQITALADELTQNFGGGGWGFNRAQRIAEDLHALAALAKQQASPDAQPALPHFDIINAICRMALVYHNEALEHQISRLIDVLDGEQKQRLSNLLRSALKQPPAAPASRLVFSGKSTPAWQRLIEMIEGGVCAGESTYADGVNNAVRNAVQAVRVFAGENATPPSAPQCEQAALPRFGMSSDGEPYEHGKGAWVRFEDVAALSQGTTPAAPQIEVWFGSMPESNGRENWTVTLRRKERPGNASPHAIHRLMSGVSVYRSEFKDRAHYEADRLRFLLGEIDKEPHILDYDADLHSGYKEPAAGVDEQATGGHAYLCRAWGETDLPCAAIARSRDEVRQFYIDQWLGDETSIGYDGTPTLPKLMQEFDDNDWLDRPQISYEFEIGGVSVERVFA